MKGLVYVPIRVIQDLTGISSPTLINTPPFSFFVVKKGTYKYSIGDVPILFDITPKTLAKVLAAKNSEFFKRYYGITDRKEAEEEMLGIILEEMKGRRKIQKIKLKELFKEEVISKREYLEMIWKINEYAKKYKLV